MNDMDFLDLAPVRSVLWVKKGDVDEQSIGKVNRIIGQNPMLRRAVMNPATSLHAVEMALHKAKMRYIRWYNPVNKRVVVVFQDPARLSKAMREMPMSAFVASQSYQEYLKAISS